MKFEDTLTCAICEDLYSFSDLYEYGEDWACESCLRDEEEKRPGPQELADRKYHRRVDEGEIR